MTDLVALLVLDGTFFLDVETEVLEEDDLTCTSNIIKFQMA
jgi:hypothetical protein